ncbi:MAG: type II secretion system protein N [Armatimonadota bacterium]|nr:type II secretion system protein N [Armatimonadota bacterium]
MKLEQKRAIGLAVLGVVVVACVAYISFSVAVPKTTGAKTAQQVGKEQQKTGSDQESRQDSAVASAEELSADRPPLPRRDPFALQPLPGEQLQQSVTASQAERPSRSSRSKFRLPRTPNRLPAIDVKPLNPFAGATENPPVQAQTPQPEEEITVTGVVRGEGNVAIVRLGESGRHVVREGETIDGRYRVASITTDRVVFIYNNRPVAIKVGGNKNAAK